MPESWRGHFMKRQILRGGNVQHGNSFSTVFATAFHAPSQHLLAQHLIKRLPEEILNLEAAVCLDRSIRREDFVPIAPRALAISDGIEWLTVFFGVLPFDQNCLNLAFVFESNKGVGARYVSSSHGRSLNGPFVEVILAANPLEADVVGVTVWPILDRQHLERRRVKG